MAHVRIDNSKEQFGANVSLADLAQFSFKDMSSERLNIYRAAEILMSDWRWEVDTFDYEYGLGMSAYFKDGSAIHVAAPADGDDRYYDYPLPEKMLH